MHGGKSSGGGSLLGVVALLVGITALGAAYFLYEQSRETHARAGTVDQRVQALEAQLLSTGDELSESDAAVRVRMKELDTEVRKLWDDRKKNIAEYKQRDSKLAAQEKSLAALTSQQRNGAAQLTAVSAQVDELVEMLERSDLANMQKNLGDANRALAQLKNQLATLEQRVLANEEWVESVNVFRRQVNERLNQIQNPATPAPVLR